MKTFNICKFNQDMFPAERIASKEYWENKKSRWNVKPKCLMMDTATI